MTEKPSKPVNRLRISDGILESCRCFNRQDYMTALLWASKVMKIVGKTHVLSDDEARYLHEVFTTYGENSQ
jgi:hypothetical protein